MKRKRALRLAALVLAVGLLVSTALAAGGTIPALAERKNGQLLYENKKASVDASNLAEGYVGIRYTGKKQVKIKVQITKEKGTTYTYQLRNDGVGETYLFSEGDGVYRVKVFENTTGIKYAQAYACKLTVKLRHGALPFLYPNQYVNYKTDEKVAEQAHALCQGKKTVPQKVEAIYCYVVEHLTYDNRRARDVASGYLPDVETVLKDGTGICFDYAALMAAMLRIEGIPCKLVVGYSGENYHAWVSVYSTQAGWVDQTVYLDKEDWATLDPTIASNVSNSASVKEYVGDAAHYTPIFVY